MEERMEQGGHMNKRSSISDVDVLRAYVESSEVRGKVSFADLDRVSSSWPEQILERRFGCAPKVAFAAMERAFNRGLIEYGVSLRAGWITEKGRALLAKFGGSK